MIKTRSNVSVFEGENPTDLYLEALLNLDVYGKEVSPKGKRTKMLHPAMFRFLNPEKQVTFVKGRKINPFFQLTESLWILAGRSDVKWLELFNKNIVQFSDDGIRFNAPYGERLRAYGNNDARSVIYNPVDQLADVYRKLAQDKYTRQAVAILYNPLFDNATYTIDGPNRDIACNISLVFSIYNDKLDMMVTNRSNDLHWGLFGANLAQFTFIQKTLAAWLDIPVGVYTHVTNNLHIYLDDFGADCTKKMYEANEIDDPALELGKIPEWEIFEESVKADPIKMPKNPSEFNVDIGKFCKVSEGVLYNLDEALENSGENDLIKYIRLLLDGFSSDYVKDVFCSSAAYIYYKAGKLLEAIMAISYMSNTYWKIACYDFIHSAVKKSEVEGVKELYTSEIWDLAAELTGGKELNGIGKFERWLV